MGFSSLRREIFLSLTNNMAAISRDVTYEPETEESTAGYILLFITASSSLLMKI